MALNPTKLMADLEALTQEEQGQGFVFGFLSLFKTPRSTITRLEKDLSTDLNVALDPESGAVGLRQRLYIKPIYDGQEPEDVLQGIRESGRLAQYKMRFLIVTDFKNLMAYDSEVDDILDCAYQDLYRNYSFFLPLHGLEKSQVYSESPADTKAAERMGRLFEQIRLSNQIETAEQVHSLNVFLTRLLFCFFADDTGIFTKNQFANALESTTTRDGHDLQAFFEQLFEVLNTPENSPNRKSLATQMAAFPYVNGGLFAKTFAVPSFTQRTRRMLLDSARLDWSEINPDIFGSMFQGVINPEQRSQLGQHYTSVPNIMKVIQPLFLQPLEDDLEKILRNKKPAERLKDLTRLSMRLENIKIFDPACGSGNFLIIAYKELRKFEIKVFKYIRELNPNTDIFASGITLNQFYGVEIDDFAHEVAMLSLWLAEHQMNMLFKTEINEPKPALPLKEGGNIICGNSLRINWEEFCPRTDRANDEVYIIGNPPFGGKQYRTSTQNEDLDMVFSNLRVSYRNLDYVVAWFLKGAQYISRSCSRLALVATNSVSQGEQVSLIWPFIFNLNISIAFAYQTFSWKNNARDNAAVHVVIIGLVDNNFLSSKRLLFKPFYQEWLKEEVENISPYLLQGSNTVISSRRSPISNVSPMVFGSMPNDGGYLLLSTEEKNQLIKEEPQAAKWIKRLLGSEEYINNGLRWCLWLLGASDAEIKQCPLVCKRVEEVRKARLNSSRLSTQRLATTPHLFGEIRHPASGEYIIVPRVSSERRLYIPIGFFEADVICSDAAQMIPNATLYEFGILTSLAHNDWMRIVAGRLKSDYRYSGTLVYNNFPWPEVTPTQMKAIEQLAEEVILTRENYPSKSLAQLYDLDEMPDDLRAAHHALDMAVDKLYRKTPFADSSERVAHLFARYEALIAAEVQ